MMRWPSGHVIHPSKNRQGIRMIALNGQHELNQQELHENISSTKRIFNSSVI